MVGQRPAHAGLAGDDVKAAPLITHRFPLEDYERAYHVLRAGPESSGPKGKVMLDINPEDAP